MTSELLTDCESAYTLSERVRASLGQHHLPVLRRLRVEVVGDCVMLAGHVGAFYQKQLAIECCKRIPGVRQIVDQIEVDQEPELSRHGLTKLRFDASHQP